METLTEYAQYAAGIIAGLVVILNVIAPLTATDWDNKALDGLRWFEDKVLKLLLPQMREPEDK